MGKQNNENILIFINTRIMQKNLYNIYSLKRMGGHGLLAKSRLM